MPGTPQGRDIGEAGPKSATLLTIGETIGIEEVPTSAVEFVNAEIDITEADDEDALRDLLRREMRMVSNGLVSGHGVVRLSLIGGNPRRWQIQRDEDIWSETASNAARETGNLWLDKMVLNLADADGEAIGGGAIEDACRNHGCDPG